jgi:hypothetical protein
MIAMKINRMPLRLGKWFPGSAVLFLLSLLPAVAQLQRNYYTNAPVALNEDTPTLIQLQGSFIIVCGGGITFPTVYSISVAPTHGTLSAITLPPPGSQSPATVTYTPNQDFHGMDSFVWVLADVTCNSSIVTQPIFVNAVNDSPLAQSRSVTVPANRSSPITLSGSDPDADALTFVVGAGPTHGTLSGTAPNLTYTPSLNYIGSDSFTFAVVDSSGASNSAAVNISVKNGVTINSVTVNEGNSGSTNAVFTVSLTAPVVELVKVAFQTQSGFALPGTGVATVGTDYLATNGVLLFDAGGPTSKTVLVRVLGDQLVELNEVFTVTLGTSANGALLNSVGIGIIRNDDASVGTSELSPDLAVVRVGETWTGSLTWTHPDRWRLLDAIDLLIADDQGVALAVRWQEPEDTFSLFHPAANRFVRTVAAGSRARFETEAATLDLEQCGSHGSGPTGPSVTINYSLTFKHRAAGRIFSVEAFATDDSGNEQGFEPVGAVSVLDR